MTEALFLELLEAAFAAYKEWKSGSTAAEQKLVNMRDAAINTRTEAASVEAAADADNKTVIDKRFPPSEP